MQLKVLLIKAAIWSKSKSIILSCTVSRPYSIPTFVFHRLESKQYQIKKWPNVSLIKSCTLALWSIWCFFAVVKPKINLRPDQTYLIFCCLSPGGLKFFHFQKKKIWSHEWVNVRVHVASPQMARLWLSVKVVSGCTVLFGSRIIHCFQEELSFWQFIVKISWLRRSSSWRVGLVMWLFFSFIYRPPGSTL